ncbi:MAG: winged helix-turn-helix domain-containing protein [Vulcanimicrobiaceae bacterium]
MMPVYELGPFRLDAEQLILSLDGEPLALGPKVVQTLLVLVERPGEVVAKPALLACVWPEGYVDEANLAQNIYVLRKTFRAHWRADAIATVPRHGYRFVGAVRQVATVASLPLAEGAVAHRPVPARLWSRMYLRLAVACAVLVAVAGIAAGAHAYTAAVPHLSAHGRRLYQIGRYYWSQRTAVGVRKSLSYFAQVVDADPGDARGYAGLAAADAIMGDYHYGKIAPKVYFARAQAYARKALALDADCAQAYAALGLIDIDTHHLARGVRTLRRAIALDPRDGPAHQWYGTALLLRGHVARALRELKTAADIDPLSVAATDWLSSAAYYDRRYDQAIAYARQTLDLSPQRVDAWAEIGLAYEARGNMVHAIGAFHTFAHKCASCRAEAAALLVPVYVAGHHPKRARAELRYAEGHRRAVSSEDLAIALASLHRQAAALAVLRHARPTMLRVDLAIDPRFDVLRRDAAIVALTKSSAS